MILVMRRTLPAILGFAALVLSPQAACTDDGGLTSAQITALRKSVEGTWEYKDGATTIQFRMTQSSRDFDADNPHASLSLVGDAYACGNHGLVKPASACIDVYHMPVDVEIVAGGAFDMPRGVLTSYGGGATNTELWIALGETQLQGQLANDTVTLQNTTTKTLRRIAP